MTLLEVVLLGVSLSMDAFAVSIATGISLKKARFAHAAKVGAFFGGFQFLMPVLGYLAGSQIGPYIEKFDHWIAFALLAIIGGKMLIEALQPGDKDEHVDPTATGKLFILAIATSIDALAVGISLALIKANIWYCSTLIGIITFTFSAVGVMMGKKLGEKCQKGAGIIGGIILILIGLKILLEHLGFLG